MHATHSLMVIHPSAKYGMPMSKRTKIMGRTRICTDRQTERYIYIDRRTDGRTDRRTDKQTDRVITIYPPELSSWGYKNKYVHFSDSNDKYFEIKYAYGNVNYR